MRRPDACWQQPLELERLVAVVVVVVVLPAAARGAAGALCCSPCLEVPILVVAPATPVHPHQPPAAQATTWGPTAQREVRRRARRSDAMRPPPPLLPTLLPACQPASCSLFVALPLR